MSSVSINVQEFSASVRRRLKEKAFNQAWREHRGMHCEHKSMKVAEDDRR